VLGGPPGHPLFRDLLDRCGHPAAYSSVESSGATVLRQAIPRHSDVQLCEPGLFFAHDAAGMLVAMPESGARLAEHLWSSSRVRLAQGRRAGQVAIAR
jgi:hypothetical protein